MRTVHFPCDKPFSFNPDAGGSSDKCNLGHTGCLTIVGIGAITGISAIRFLAVIGKKAMRI